MCAHFVGWLVTRAKNVHKIFIHFSSLSHAKMLWSSGPRTAVENLQPTFNVELKLSLGLFFLTREESENGVCFNSRMSPSIPKRFTNNNKKVLFSSSIISSDDRQQTPPDDRASSHWENIHQIYNFSPTSTRRSSDIGTSFPTEIITLCMSRVFCYVSYLFRSQSIALIILFCAETSRMWIKLLI